MMVMSLPARTGSHAAAPTLSRLSLHVLGPLRLWFDGVEIDPGPPRQAYLLAVLLAHAGRPVSTGKLVDLVWGDDVPATAINILHKYVGALRRLLEPDLPARHAGSYLLRHGDGYLFTADVVDLTAFREILAKAHAEPLPDAALDNYLRGLALWRGPAGDGLILGPAAMPIFTALDDEFFDACVTAASLAVQCGRPGRVLRPLRLAASATPLNEAVQAALISVLSAAGRQAEALCVYATVRRQLADELGVDPGPALQAALDDALGNTATREPRPTVTPAYCPTSAISSARWPGGSGSRRVWVSRHIHLRHRGTRLRYRSCPSDGFGPRDRDQ